MRLIKILNNVIWRRKDTKNFAHRQMILIFLLLNYELTDESATGCFNMEHVHACVGDLLGE